MTKKSVTLDLKVFIGLISALVGAGGYATIGTRQTSPPIEQQSAPREVEVIASKIELLDTAQAWKNRYMMDSITRVGAKVRDVERKIDTMMARQDRLIVMLEPAKKSEDLRVSSRCPTYGAQYSMRSP